MFFCSMCPFTTVNFESCNIHIVRHHRNDPNLRVNCCIDECQYVTRSWNVYKMHVSRMHRHFNVENNVQDNNIELFNVDDEQADMDEARQENETMFDQKFIDAKYLLALKVDHHMIEV